MAETPEEQIARLESDLAHVAHELDRQRIPLTVRYRCNVKDSVGGVRTTDATIEITGPANVLDCYVAIGLQSDWQAVVDGLYPPPTPKGTASSAT